MPKIFKTLPEKYEAITRPVVMGIVKQVMANTGIEKNTTIMYLGDSNEAAQPGSSIDSQSDSITTSHNNKVTVSMEESYYEDRYSSQVLHRPENAFIFLDKKLETYIKPVYSSTRVGVTFTFRAKDKTTAIRWRDDFKTHLTDMRDIQLYEATYHYAIPLELLNILEMIYDLRENQGGYGEPLDKYFMEHSDPRIRVVTNQGGKLPLITIAETQGQLVGVWDFDRAPRQMEKEGDIENFAIEIGFNFHYEQPVGCDMSYPLMIHNQLISKEYRPTYADRPDADISKKTTQTSSGKYMSMFNYGDDKDKLITQQGILIPPFDEFIPNQVITSSMRVFSVLLSISEDDKRNLFNIKDLMPEYEIKPTMLELFQSEAPFIHMPYRSIFNISLYRGTTLMYWDNLSMDSDLNVIATRDLDIREYYHVRLSVMYDLTALQPADRERLKVNGCAFADIMKQLMPFRVPVKTIGTCYAPGTEIDSAANDLDKYTRGVMVNGIIQFNTVETLYIEAIKKG